MLQQWFSSCSSRGLGFRVSGSSRGLVTHASIIAARVEAFIYSERSRIGRERWGLGFRVFGAAFVAQVDAIVNGNVLVYMPVF